MTPHCRYCHHPLTDPRSIERGFGPVCAGVAARAPDLFSQPPSIDDVLADRFGTTLDGLTYGVDIGHAPEIAALLATEILRLRRRFTT